MFTEKDLFISGHDDVNIYRIPSLIVAPSGAILAFVEARQGDDGDPTDMMLKRSLYKDAEDEPEMLNGYPRNFDYAVNWEPLRMVCPGNGEAIMNPCPVVDGMTGRLWLPCYQVFGGLTEHLKDSFKGNLLLTWSDDEGVSWAEPRDLTSELPRFIPGPGVSIQMKTGRLVVPGYWSESPGSISLSCVIYSDDHGETWRQGAVVKSYSDESQVVELSDGTLMLNCRSNLGKERRYVALSNDGGETWFDEFEEPALPEPVCQASFIKQPKCESVKGKAPLLFINPNSSDRKNLTVKFSLDDGKSWSAGRSIHSGHAAYSCAAFLKDGSIGVLYETGSEHPYEKITFARFDMQWVTGQQ